MISVTVTTDTRLIDDLSAYSDSLNTIVGELAGEVQREVAPLLLPELQFYPGQRGDEVFIWSPDPAADARARRYYFAAIRRGEIATDGEHYIRTGGYGESWQMTFGNSGSAFVIRIFSTMPGSIYVGGSLNQRSVNEAREWQIPGHTTTGWPIQVETVNFHINGALDLFGDKFTQWLGEFGILSTTTRRSARQ